MTLEAIDVALREAPDALANRLSIPSLQQSAARHLRILLLAHRFKMPYRVLRCATDAGADVYVLGMQQARRLKYSRFCKEFLLADEIFDGTPSPGLAAQIDRHCARTNIDLVLAGDAASTRSLIQVRDAINVPCFPMPTLAQFDELNNKWNFGLLCGRLGIDYPASRLFSSFAALKQELDCNGLAVDSMAKPLSRDGGEGCLRLTRGHTISKLSRISYAPILLQEFIEGEDIGASVFCWQGVIKAFIAHKYEHGIYQSFYNAGLYESIARIMTHVRASGIFNFDMRRAADGRIIFLECNPRCYFKIAMSMIAGINLVECGVKNPGEGTSSIICPSKIVRFPKAALLQALRLRPIESESWAALDFVLADPVAYALELLGCQEPAAQLASR